MTIDSFPTRAEKALSSIGECSDRMIRTFTELFIDAYMEGVEAGRILETPAAEIREMVKKTKAPL